MTFINQADETRRQAREGKEKGAPEARDPRPKIDGENGYYIDQFSPDPTSGSGSGSTDNADGSSTTNTQDNDGNTGANGTESSGGGGGGGGTSTTFTPNPLDFAEEGGSATNADDLDSSDSAPDYGESCIGCDVQEMEGMTEGDCAGGSGDCFKIHYDGVFPTPSGWTDPDTPPDEPTWELGKKYTDIFADDKASLSESEQAHQDYYTDNLYNPALTYITTAVTPAYSEAVSSYSIRVSTRLKSNDSEVGALVNSITKVTCTPVAGDPICPLVAPPAETEWPDDGCYDLIFDGVAFTAHDLDPNAPDKYKGAGTSTVDYCTDGGADGTTRTGVDGGFQVDTTNMTRVYDANGNLIAAGDSTQTFIDRYKP